MPRKFGIEIEFGGSRQTVGDALNAAGLGGTQHGYQGHSTTGWVVKFDGSVSGGGEVVSPPLDFDDPNARAQVDRAITAMKAGGATTLSSAGIHVHIDATDLSPEQVAGVARVFAKFEDVIFRIASSGWQSMRPGASSYARPIPHSQTVRLAAAKDERQLATAWYGLARGDDHSYHARQHGHSSRYYGLNLHSWFYRRTIEFRVFNSSLNIERIQGYIALCVALVEDARRGNRRSVNKRYALGGMSAGTTKADNAFHRLLQVVRYDADMSVEDMKRLRKIWRDSVPQNLGATVY